MTTFAPLAPRSLFGDTAYLLVSRRHGLKKLHSSAVQCRVTLIRHFYRVLLLKCAFLGVMRPVSRGVLEEDLFGGRRRSFVPYFNLVQVAEAIAGGGLLAQVLTQIIDSLSWSHYVLTAGLMTLDAEVCDLLQRPSPREQFVLEVALFAALRADLRDAARVILEDRVADELLKVEVLQLIVCKHLLVSGGAESRTVPANVANLTDSRSRKDLLQILPVKVVLPRDFFWVFA